MCTGRGGCAAYTNRGVICVRVGVYVRCTQIGVLFVYSGGVQLEGSSQPVNSVVRSPKVRVNRPVHSEQMQRRCFVWSLQKMGRGEITAVGVGVGAVEMAALRFGGPVGGCQRLLEGLSFVARGSGVVGCLLRARCVPPRCLLARNSVGSCRLQRPGRKPRPRRRPRLPWARSPPKSPKQKNLATRPVQSGCF